ncbi:MAG: hypothetical protein Kow00107_06900 [Planctomycetota bacterium]
MLDKLSKGVGEAMSAVVKALLELPAFQAECYIELLRETLSAAGPDEKLGAALEKLGPLVPSYPLLGEVKARLEGAIVSSSTSDGGISVSFPAGSFAIGGRYSRISSTSSSATLAIEIAASYNQEFTGFDFSSLRELSVGEFLSMLPAKGETILDKI